MKALIQRTILFTTAAAGLGLAAPAFAQDTAPPAAATEDGDEIIVTARRTAEAAQDVPISMTVFNQEQLDDRNVTNAQDLALFTPSLSATTSFGPINSTYAIRGFVQDTGTGPSVGVYFADVVAPRGPSQGFPAGDGAGPGVFFDLQNVQVLKGPQGTLFGRNTTGGAVLFVPRKPTDQFEGYVEGSFGNYDLRRIQAVVNVPIAETVRLRVGGDWQKRDGFAKNDSGVGPRDFDDVSYISLRGSLVIDLTPDIENYTIGTYINSDSNGHVQKIFLSPLGTGETGPVNCAPLFLNPAAFLSAQACNIINEQNAEGFWHMRSDMPDAYTKMRQWQAINTTTWRVSDNLTVKNIISYAQLWTKIHSALFGTNFFIAPGVPVGFASIRHIPDSYSSNQSTFTEELQLQGNAGDGALMWQAGAYYEDSKPKGFIGSQSPVFIGCSDPDNFICTDFTGRGVINFTAAKNTFQTRGIYAQATYALMEELKITGGIRYTWDKSRSISRQSTFFYPFGVPNSTPAGSFCTRPVITVPPLCELDLSVKSSKPTWLLDLDYTPDDDLLVYIKYARGYRTGGVKSDVPIQFAIFEPEKVDTFEVGTKISFTGDVRGHLNIAAFYNNFSNQQIQLGFIQNLNRTDPVTGAPLPIISVSPTAGPVNIGKSRIFGFEIDARIRVFEGLWLDAGYTYLNTEVKDVLLATLPTDSPYAISGQILPGDSLTFSPRHKVSVSATYTLPLDESVGDVSIGATLVYTSKQISTYGLRGLIPVFGKDFGILDSRHIVNLNVNWDRVAGSPVDLAFFVTNLFNEQYYNSVNGIFPNTGFETAGLGEPRMLGLRARFNFGE